jgi:N utilization substance protein B
MTQRRQSREIALQAMFHVEFNKDLEFGDCLKLFKTNFKATNDIWDYASELLNGVHQNQQKIDALIKTYSKNWSIDRMALVDLSLLRLSVFELKFMSPALPIEVVADEALEIAKKYSSKDASSFINGILDQISKS